MEDRLISKNPAKKYVRKTPSTAPATWPCKVEGCKNPRLQRPSGRFESRCAEHFREYDRKRQLIRRNGYLPRLRECGLLERRQYADELRSRVGDEAFFEFLEDYAQSYARGRATGRDFFAVLRRHTDQDVSDIVGSYLQGQY